MKISSFPLIPSVTFTTYLKAVVGSVKGKISVSDLNPQVAA